ncbi:protein MMS22-like isoform X2 [Coccinella septempunctata]|nr:protein MMS22-like isoform X2 [Coccinella septempunctata]
MINSTNVNIYVSFIIRMVRENRVIDKISPPLVKTLQDASENQNNFHIIKEFFNGFYQIVKFSKSLQLHQWTLIDQWIIKYLATCYLPDLEAALKTLLYLMRKINSEESWSHWQDTFKKNIYPVLKQIGNNSSCPCCVGEMAAEMSKSSPDIMNDAFSFFTAEAIHYKVTKTYLCNILKDYPTDVSLTQPQEKSAIQCWIRICLFSTQNFEEITTNIMKLESMPSCIKKEVLDLSDPLIHFIEILGLNKSLFLSSPVLSRFCGMCFESLDQSLSIHLPQIKDEAVIIRIYTYLAIALLKCNTLLYDRHKMSTPATKLISCLLFPTEFVMGKISHPFLGAIRKTWHLYFQAMLKLGQDNDAYVQRTLRDLISKYIPYYSVAESPIYLCLTRESSAKVIFEKVSTIYFKHPTKENEQNVLKALKILNEFVKSSTSVSLLNIVVQETLFGLCEVYIFHSQRNFALNIIMYIVTCQFYDQLKEEVLKSLLLLTEKHLAFNSKTYFNLVTILAKTIPSEILILKESIVEKIKNIERIRGIGYDENLRSYLSTLKANLNC